jgi:hypothetical protein
VLIGLPEVLIEAFGSESHQLRGSRQVPVGVRRCDVAEISGEHGDVLVNVEPGLVPGDQGGDGKPVPKVVCPRARSRCADTHRGGELAEDLPGAAAAGRGAG